MRYPRALVIALVIGGVVIYATRRNARIQRQTAERLARGEKCTTSAETTADPAARDLAQFYKSSSTRYRK